MTDSDFQSITAGICGPDGQLKAAEFDTVMRQQIKQAAQAKLALVGGVRSAEDVEFMQFGTLKMILLEQVLCPTQTSFIKIRWDWTRTYDMTNARPRCLLTKPL